MSARLGLASAGRRRSASTAWAATCAAAGKATRTIPPPNPARSVSALSEQVQDGAAALLPLAVCSFPGVSAGESLPVPVARGSLLAWGAAPLLMRVVCDITTVVALGGPARRGKDV